MQSSGRFGRKESALSLFQIDSGKEWRGGQRQSFLLAKTLHESGYPYRFVVQYGSPLHEKSKEAKLSIMPLKMRGEFDILASLRLSSAMKRNGCRLAHFHDAHSVALGWLAASWARVPLRVISRRVDFPIKENFLSRLKYKENIDAIIAISEGVKKVLLEGGIDSRKIHVIPSGIDFSPFERARSSDYLRRELNFVPDDYLVGIVAALTDHKGHKFLIEASRILKEKAPRIKIIIVGEGPLQIELSKLVREIRVEDMVFFLGFREDIPQIMGSLDLFVLSSYLEGMGSSLLDAMASRLPIVATKVGGIPEVVIHGESGFLVPPRNPKSLANAILKLFNDRELSARFGQKGYEIVYKKFSAEAMARKVIDVYEMLAMRKGVKLLKR